MGGLGIRDRVIGSAPLAATTTSPGERVATNAALPSPKVQREPQLPASAASVELGLIRDRAIGSALPVETTTSPDVRTATSVALPSHSEIVARDESHHAERMRLRINCPGYCAKGMRDLATVAESRILCTCIGLRRGA